MADIISIDAKLGESKAQKEAVVRKRKIQAVRKIFQCTHCALKCEKCGTQIGSETPDERSAAVIAKTPFRLCASCSEEYVDYIARCDGRGDPDCYWHNQAWRDLWSSWIAYRKAYDRYLKSGEFLELLKELKRYRPED